MQGSIQPHNQKPASVWSSGGADYNEISRGIADMIEHCVLRLAPQPDERVLDLATGATARAALQSVRRTGPARLVLAVPVAAAEALTALAPLCDHILCLERPTDFYAVGQFYRDFTQVEDDEVMALLGALPICSTGEDEGKTHPK